MREPGGGIHATLGPPLNPSLYTGKPIEKKIQDGSISDAASHIIPSTSHVCSYSHSLLLMSIAVVDFILRPFIIHSRQCRSRISIDGNCFDENYTFAAAFTAFAFVSSRSSAHFMSGKRANANTDMRHFRQFFGAAIRAHSSSHVV